MRQIKFRSWLKKEKRMMYDFNTISDHPLWTDSEKATLMQCTGLKDKNGMEIYEGDVMSSAFGQHNTEIVFDTNIASFLAVEVKGNKSWSMEAYLDFDTAKVIGNIYENPGLLEGEENGQTGQ